MSESNYYTSVIFSKVCSLLSARGSCKQVRRGERRQVNRGRVLHSAWRGVFLAYHRPSWMDNWALCKPSWQRGRRQRAKTPQPFWKSSIASKYQSLGCSSLFSGNLQTASSPPGSHETTLQSSAPPPLPSENLTRWDGFTSHLSEAFSTLAVSGAHDVEAGKKRRAVTVSVYISAAAEGRMRGGFHARETVERFPNSGLTDTHKDMCWSVWSMFISTLHAL